MIKKFPLDSILIIQAFNDYQYQRANLVFISKGTRADGILELTYPAVNTPAIPFFSLI